MPPYVVSLIGLLLDIVGVALLSVEAIKLENVRKLHDRILRPMEEYAKPLGFPLTGDGMPTPNLRYARTRFDGCVWWALTHTGTGALTLWLVWVVVRAHVPGILPASGVVRRESHAPPFRRDCDSRRMTTFRPQPTA